MASLSAIAVMVAGPKTARIIVEFDEARAQPIALTLKAHVTRDYWVSLDPAIWAMQASPNGPLTVRKRVRATEFLSKAIAGEGDLRDCRVVVSSLSPVVRVLEVGQWRPRGWTIDGLARDAEILFEVQLPAGFGPKDDEVFIEFQHSPSSERKEDPAPQTARCRLLLRTV